MRRLIITLLLAGTAAMPAMAQDQERSGRFQRDRGGEQATTEQRGERAERVRAERAERRAEASESRERPAFVERIRARRAEQEAATPAEAPRRPRFERQPTSETQVRVTRETRDNQTIKQRIGERIREQRAGTEVVRDRNNLPDRVETRHWGNNRQWSNHWRSDRRYDWRRYRDYNRSIFRFGHYNDPYGYGYRRFSIGFSLWPSYFGSNYWLDDPWQYRLPPAYGPYRWVRYYDDALLVNVYTGQVVDVERNFFW